MTLNVQFITMVSMVIGGFYLGIAHDTYERFSNLWRNRRILAYVLAITFWLSQAVILFVLLYRANYGELRVYVFLACLLGLSIYQVFAANLYRKMLEGFLTILRYILTTLLTIFTVIVIRPLQLLFRLLFAILKMIGHVFLSLIIFLLLPFKIMVKLLYRLLPKKIKKIFDKKSSFYSIIENIYNKFHKLISFIRR